MRFISKVKEGKLQPEHSQKLVEFIGKNEGKQLVFEVGKKTKKRTLPENAYFHGVILAMIADETGIDRKDKAGMKALKAWLCDRFLDHEVHDVPEKLKLSQRDTVLMVARGTSDLTTKEFEVFCEQCRVWASEFLSLNIPEPNEEEMEKYWLSAEE